MANSLALYTSINSVVDGFRLSGTTNIVSNTTSSNVVAQSTAVTASGWTQLTLGNLTDVAGIWLWNDNTTTSASVISVATGSTGQCVLTILNPGQASLIAWSGSLTSVYAKVLTSNPNQNGTIQYLAQQS